MDPIYLDHAATTPLADEVREAMLPYLGAAWGNPSSVHRRGIAAREAVDRARAQVARAVGAEPRNVIFTSGGTEANNLALFGLMRGPRPRGGGLWVGPTEHASVRAAADALEQEGFDVERGELRPSGEVDLDALDAALTPDTRLVAQMLVSNEFGSIYPTSCIAALLKARDSGAHLHVDAIQALGKLPLSLEELGADSVALSAHKVNGPQGVGALVCARELPLHPLLHGGGQEGGRRSGTENVAGIVGFGVAAERADRAQAATLRHLGALRAQLLSGVEGLQAVDCLAPGDHEQQQPGILSLRVAGAPAEVWLHHLDASGVVCSVGSACQANKKEISPVLLAAGLSPEEARQVLRLSLGGDNTLEEIERACVALHDVSRELARL